MLAWGHRSFVSYDGSTHSSTFEQCDLVEGTFNKTSDHEIHHTTKTWDDSGVTGEYVWHPSFHDVIDISSSSTELFSNNNIIPQPVFTAGSLSGMEISTAVTLTGGVTSGVSGSWSFSLPSLKSEADEGISAADLPSLEMTTTDFEQLGQVADTRTWWQKLSDLIIVGAETAYNSALETAVWFIGKVDAAATFVANNSGAILDAVQLGLDAAGFYPGWGAIPDILNGVISLGRGNYRDAFDSFVAAIPGPGDYYAVAAKGIKYTNKIANAATAANASAKLIRKANDKMADGKKFLNKLDDAGQQGPNLVAKPRRNTPQVNCFVAGTKVLMRMAEDPDAELLDELAASGTMAETSDESSAIAASALGLGIGLVVIRERANGKDRRRQRPRRKSNSRRQTDEDDNETAMTNGEIPEPADPVEATNANSGEVHTKNAASPRRYLSGTLTALMLTCFAVSGWLWLQPLMRTQEAQAVSVDAVRLPRENAPTRVTRELVNIEDVQLGRRVVGRNPLREQTQLPSDIHPETHRTIRLEMIQYGTLYELAFVRSLTWLSEQQAQVGGMIQLVMTEMGLDGPAHVISIDPCPEIEPDDGTGRMVVTGTMKHLAGNVLEIQTADDTEPLGVTDTHPFWSVDRQDFVVAGQLTVGESLEQADGTVTQITRITPTRGPPVMVYNLEIDAEHVFHVGEDGLLVHNSCPDVVPGPPKRTVNDLPGLDSTGKVHGDLPHPRDLGSYDPDDLRILRDELRKSVQERIRLNSTLGPKGNHGLRQGQEQDLIHSIDKYLEELGR